MFACLLLLIVPSQSVATECSKGCSSGCISDYTCKRSCSDNYDQDNSCLHCSMIDTVNTSKPVFINNDNDCIKSTNRVQKTSWLPEEDNIQELFFKEKVEFNLNQNSDVDYSFCYNKQKYRIGKWFKYDMDNLTTDVVKLSVYKTSSCENNLIIDITNSPRSSPKATCISYTSMNYTYNGREIKVPKVRPPKIENGEKFYYYVFVSVSQICDVKIEVEVGSNIGKDAKPFIEIDQEIVNKLHENLGTALEISFPFEAEGYFAYPVCFQTRMYKCILFTLEYDGNYSLLIDGTKSNRINLLQEYKSTENEDGSQNNECVYLWTGQRYGVLAESQNLGVMLKIGGSPNKRHFAMISTDQTASVELRISVICPDHCGENDTNGARGTCVVSEKKCVCNPGYGGDDCHKLCYYNKVWQTDNTNLCYFGAPGCDQYCHCTEGRALKNHFCITNECLSGKTAPSDECIAGTEALRNCV
ncbi:protein tyrosine kinase domain containing protein, partial [Entamoeba invadens IP1]